jgi:predicted RNA-binding protein YlxR (DUF448 family)
MTARKPGTIRTCVGCRRTDSAERLWRFVLVDGHVLPDASGRMAGRGAWLHPNAECARAAIRHGGFSRSLHRAVPTDEVERCLERLLEADLRSSVDRQ